MIANIDGYERHPIFDLRSEGVRVTHNTDDPGVFHATVEDEYRTIGKAAEASIPPLSRRRERLEEIRYIEMQEVAVNLENAAYSQQLSDATSALKSVGSGRSA